MLVICVGARVVELLKDLKARLEYLQQMSPLVCCKRRLMLVLVGLPGFSGTETPELLRTKDAMSTATDSRQTLIGDYIL